MDCGGSHVMDSLSDFVEGGEITDITEAWVTHYHDDHVDGFPDFQRRFPCVTRTTQSVADVVQEPLAWRLPCISPAVARIDHRPGHGESWL